MCFQKIVNMIIRKIGGMMLIKQISCDCKFKFDTITWDSNQKWNNDKYQCECGIVHVLLNY